MNIKNMSPVLYLLCGLPGSGKTTLAKKISNECNAIRFSPDEWLYELGLSFDDDKARCSVEKLQWKIAQNLLKIGNNIVLENGFWFKAERDSYRFTAEKLGAITKIYFLEVSTEELKKRLNHRNQLASRAIPIVNFRQLDKWINIFEPPTNEELY